MARSTPALLVLVLLLAPALAGCLAPAPTGAADPHETHTEALGSRQATDLTEATESNDTAPEQNGTSTGDEPAGDETVNGTAGPAGTGVIYPGGDPTTIYHLASSMMRWQKTDLTVLVVPPGYSTSGQDALSPMDSLFLRAVEDSIVHWKEAIDTHGSEEIRDDISFEVHVLGRDVSSPSDLSGVDIYIGNPPGGIVLGGLAYYGLSPRCVISNFALPSMDYQWMFGVSAHEFGHCLGMSHPDDHDPWFDLMSYSWMNQPDDAADLALDCVSNLNLMAVHEAFAPAFGRPAQGPVSISADEYFLVDCAGRFLDAL